MLENKLILLYLEKRRNKPKITRSIFLNSEIKKSLVVRIFNNLPSLF